MRWVWIAPALIGAMMALSGCGRGEANEFPPQHQAEFHRSCPASDPVCVCIWDEITHAVTPDVYEELMQRFRREGLMNPKITRARTVCLERNRS